MKDSGHSPLSRWADTIEKLTKLKRDTHLQKPYTVLLRHLNAKEFDGKLINKVNCKGILPQRPMKIEALQNVVEDISFGSKGDLVVVADDASSEERKVDEVRKPREKDQQLSSSDHDEYGFSETVLNSSQKHSA